MRRAIARGRIVPQSFSTDPRIGQLSLKAALLYDRLWINADDQGRLTGNPDEIKYAACPNIDQVAKPEIPELLKEMEEADLIKVYSTSKQKAIQLLDWWQEQKLQWAYPSRYPPPDGWTDHLRYHPTPKEIITENWPPSDQSANELLPSKPPSTLPSKLQQREKESKREIEKETGRRKGRSPSALGSRPPPADRKLAEISKTYEENIGILTPMVADELKQIATKYSVDWFRDAVAEAVKNNVRRLSYVQSILERWAVEGKSTAKARDRPKLSGTKRLKQAWKGEEGDRDTS